MMQEGSQAERDGRSVHTYAEHVHQRIDLQTIGIKLPTGTNSSCLNLYGMGGEYLTSRVSQNLVSPYLYGNQMIRYTCSMTKNWPLYCKLSLAQKTGIPAHHICLNPGSMLLPFNKNPLRNPDYSIKVNPWINLTSRVNCSFLTTCT